jgi:TRAP transporter TAXI family solute receptor
MEAAVRPGNYVFTTPPGLIGAAMGARGPFEDKGNPKFEEIRALFPIPSLTMHFVVRDDAGVSSFADLEGKTILLGRGSFGAREGEKYLNLFGLEGKVTLADVELSNAVSALKNRQIDGFVTAGSYPAPNVIEAAAGTGVTVLSLSPMIRSRRPSAPAWSFPAGTYPGVDSDVVTTSLPVVAYTTTQMDDDTAYALTKTYWEQKEALGGQAAWWNGVSPDMLSNITSKMHPGALKYYDEQGVTVPDAIR